MYTAFKNPIFPNWIELVKKTKKVYPKKKRKQRWEEAADRYDYCARKREPGVGH